MIFDEILTLRTINEAPNDFAIKIFLYLAMKQPQDGIRGYRIDKTQLQFDLKLGKSTFFNSLHWLKENTVVNELKLGLESDFMVNPFIVMNNCDRKERITEWSRRVRLDDDKIKKNRERRRREQLKKKNQQ